MIILLSFNKRIAFAEHEVVVHFKNALHDLGEKIVILDPDHKDIETGEPIHTDNKEIKFAISLHITIPPLPNIINYLCVWDPFVWRKNYKDIRNLLRYDDYLLIDTPSIIQPIKKLLRRFIMN